MVRFLFRLAALASLAAAVILAVVDATRSVAASALVVSPLRESWQAAAPESLTSAKASIENGVHPYAWVTVDGLILAAPGFVVFGLLSILLYAIGRRQARRPSYSLADR